MSFSLETASVFSYSKYLRLLAIFVAPKFIIKPTRNYTSENGLAKNTSYNADIYVLCYYSWLDKKTTDVTNLNHWKFWVFSLNELLHVFDGHHSITVKKLE